MTKLALVLAGLVVLSPIATGQIGVNSAVHVTAAAASLVTAGLAESVPADAASYEPVAAPSVRNAPNTSGYAQVTLAPWVESNGWRYARGLRKANYHALPRGSAGLAAAETYVFGVQSIVDPDPADVEDLGSVLRFIKAHEAPPLPPVSNLGVIDDGTPAMAEVLNMLTRRNLLYRVFAPSDEKVGASLFKLLLKLGSQDFPRELAGNPSDLAARVREKLGDANRLVRVFGTSTVVARVMGDGARERVFLLSYARSRGSQPDVRVSVLGKWPAVTLGAYGAPADAKAIDVQVLDRTTEFTLPAFNTLAIVDLKK